MQMKGRMLIRAGPKGEIEALSPKPEFRLLTNHGNALLLIARDPRIRLRDIANILEITERRAQRIVTDLVQTGYLEREREGRRNVYRVALHLPLRLPFQSDIDLGTLMAILPPYVATPD
jgi:DNA-binding MarR family transcriptional regulator